MNRYRWNGDETGLAQLGCPKCGTINHCGCEACMRRFRQPGDVLWVREGLEDGYEACGVCGHTLHMSEWEDIEVEYYRSHGMWGKQPDE